MKGMYNMIIQNRQATYKFSIKRNITILKGDSATGKTLLLKLIDDYNSVEDSGVKVYIESSVETSVNIDVMTSRDWKNKERIEKNTIYFIDEYYSFVKTDEFAKFISDTGIYVVIINREKLSALPFSVSEIYTLSMFEGLHIFEPIYKQKSLKHLPDVVITEDSNAGYQFFTELFNRYKVECLAAGGNSKVFTKLKNIYNDDKRYLIIVDSAAFGAFIGEITEYFKNKNVEIYLPESFEWLLLKTKTINIKDLEDKLKYTYNYVDSIKYKSWERFYTYILVNGTNKSNHPYNKNTLDNYYKRKVMVDRVIENDELCNLLDKNNITEMNIVKNETSK